MNHFYSFRKSIAGKKINYGDFCCKGNINLWEKIINIYQVLFVNAKLFFTRAALMNRGVTGLQYFVVES